MDVFSMKPINEEKIKFILNLKRKGIRDKEVLKAMETIDRKIFLDGIFKSRSEDDIPLPISCGQTISQPSVVAKMIEKLETNKSCKVLEIGTGSGYLTAILSKLSKRVFSIERHESLKKKAESLLINNNFRNVICILGDGSLGIEYQAPFDRIIISAAAEDIPQILIKQTLDLPTLSHFDFDRHLRTWSVLRYREVHTKEFPGYPFLTKLQSCSFH